MRFKKYKFPTAVVFLCGGAAALGWLCLPHPKNPSPKSPVVAQDGVMVLPKDRVLNLKTALYRPSFELRGVATYARTQDIAAPTNGTALYFWAKPGQAFKKGDALALFAPVWRGDEPTPPKSLTLVAPFDGKARRAYRKENAYAKKGEALLEWVDENEFAFTAALPNAYADTLKIGQSVDLRQKNGQKEHAAFSGQIARIAPVDRDHKSIVVRIHTNNANAALSDGAQLSGWVDYGDLQVGAIAPLSALPNDFLQNAALQKQLRNPPYKPATPAAVKIWTIDQDGVLRLANAKVIAYRPDSKNYLLEGVAPDRLIVDARLPKSAEGMRARLR